jgi:O-antigen/teichoic acid export membrane protein
VLVAVFAFSVLSTFQQPLGLIAELGERAGIILLSKVSAIYNVVGNIVLIPLMGIMGAVIATGTAILFKNIFIWYFVRDVASFRGTGRFFAQQLLFWGCCYLLMRYLHQELSDLMTLVAAAPVIAIASFLSLRLADFSAEDRNIFQQLGGPKLQGILRLAGVSV